MTFIYSCCQVATQLSYRMVPFDGVRLRLQNFIDPQWSRRHFQIFWHFKKTCSTELLVQKCFLNGSRGYSIPTWTSRGRVMVSRISTKGQLISKCLFGVLTFFQKMNENMSTSSKVELFCSFFWKERRLEKIISNLSDP